MKCRVQRSQEPPRQQACWAVQGLPSSLQEFSGPSSQHACQVPKTTFPLWPWEKTRRVVLQNFLRAARWNHESRPRSSPHANLQVVFRKYPARSGGSPHDLVRDEPVKGPFSPDRPGANPKVFLIRFAIGGYSIFEEKPIPLRLGWSLGGQVCRITCADTARLCKP